MRHEELARERHQLAFARVVHRFPAGDLRRNGGAVLVEVVAEVALRKTLSYKNLLLSIDDKTNNDMLHK